MPATYLALVNITSLGAWAANLLGRDQVPRPWEALSEFLLNERLRWYPDRCPRDPANGYRGQDENLLYGPSRSHRAQLWNCSGLWDPLSVCSPYQGGSICRERALLYPGAATVLLYDLGKSLPSLSPSCKMGTISPPMKLVGSKRGICKEAWPRGSLSQDSSHSPLSTWRNPRSELENGAPCWWLLPTAHT